MSDGSVIETTESPLAGVPDKMWNPGQTLKIGMTGGTENVRSKVRKFAEEWTKYANIKFQYVEDRRRNPTEIEITFRKGIGTWSLIGRDALTFTLSSRVTMNLEFDDSTPDADIREDTLHEFGHALGLIHEHQSPAAGIAWDKQKIYEYFKNKANPPWDEAKVNKNFFERYSATSTNYSEYDPDSIMHYKIRPEWTLDGYSTGRNTTLSTTDKKYIAKWYPFPGADSGQLRTNDDCDQIDFRVTYGATGPDADWVRIDFILGANVTAWKAIKVPLVGNQYEQINIDSQHFSGGGLYWKSKLDSSRSIRFAKAKFLGIPTLLGYQWDVISALPGGSHLTLTWVNDHCH